MKFLGLIIDSEGVHDDADKTSAISNFPRPSNITELLRLVGMVNHEARFLPDHARMTAATQGQFLDMGRRVKKSFPKH